MHLIESLEKQLKPFTKAIMEPLFANLSNTARLKQVGNEQRNSIFRSHYSLQWREGY